MPLDIAAAAAAQAAATGMDIATAKWQDQRQLRQQGKLQQQQIAGQQEMGRYNNQLALEMWEKTNYSAQREQMQKAGLNPGLMYGMGGGGGATANATPGNVTSASAPNAPINPSGMGIQLGLQAAMQKAQIENINANTEKTKVDTEKTAGADTTKTTQDTATSAQQAETAKQQAEVLKLEQQLKGIDISIKNQTIDETVRKIQAEVQTAEGNAEKARNEGTMSTETYDEVKKQIKQTTLEQATRISLQKVGIKLGEEQIKKISNDIWTAQQQIGQGATKLNQEQQKIMIDRIRLEMEKETQGFKLATPEQIKQWTEMFTDIIGTVL